MTRGESKSAKYVYGVVPADPQTRPEGPGIGGEPVRVVKADGLAAITSDVPDTTLEAGRDELMAHSRVLEEALGGARAVLPMRFGVVMPSEASVREEFLEAYRADLEAQLAEMTGKVEMNVKGLYDEATILREALAENAEMAALREAISSAPADATYPERIRLGELVAEAIEAKRDTDERTFLDRLAPLAAAAELNDPIHERMAFNCAFLVERDRLKPFDEELERLAAEQHPRIAFKLTGPLPPHSFVELSLET
jgi:hypothetical protein